MDVWVLVNEAPYEGQTLKGVYSTPQLAEDSSDEEDDVVFKVELDAPAKRYYQGAPD